MRSDEPRSPEPRRTRAGIGAIPLLAVCWVCMGIDCCEEPPEFPSPRQQSLAPDEGAEPITRFDFATCDGAWTADGTAAWECGEAATGPRAGVEGTGSVLGTVLDGNLPVQVDESIVSPVIDLSAEAGASVFLSVWHWHAFGPNRGGGRVEILREGKWTALEPAGGYDGAIKAPGTSLHNTQGFTGAGLERMWRRSFFDLTPYVGSEVRVRFHVANRSTASQVREGWYVDDIEIWRGTFSARLPDTDLGRCAPGAVVRFALGACDEGFGVGGDEAWQCGVPTRNSDPARLDGPLTDGPAFDRDGSRMLWGTALSGDLATRVESELVSPSIDASGCAGGTLKLGFWHWYHFGPGAGGFVQVFDGGGWVDVEPSGGYPGAIGGGMPWRKAFGHEAFVSSDDIPSGWRYAVFDISAHAVSDLRLRFVVSSDNGETRPGWYVDTIEIVRDGMDAVTPAEGDPELPNCGLAPHVLDERELARDVERDPCQYGEALLESARLVHEPGEDGGPSTHRFTLDVPGPGSLCLSLVNGEERVDGAAVTFGDAAASGDATALPSGQVARMIASAREIVQTSGGQRDLVVSLEGAAGSSVELSVYHLAGDARVPVYDAAGVFSGLSNFVVGYHDEQRPSDDPSRPTTIRLYDIAFDVELPMKSYGVEGIESAVAYAVQIMDTGTCQQVREIRGWQGLTGGSRGFHQGPVQVRLRWDGTGDDGAFLDTSRSYLFRVIAAPGDIETVPPNWAEPIAGNGGSPSLPGFVSAVIEPVPFENVQVFQPAGVAAIDNRHYPSMIGGPPIKAAGGEKISVGLFLPAEVYVSSAHLNYFKAIEGKEGYDPCPQGWECNYDEDDSFQTPFPFVVGTGNILKLTRLMLKQNISGSAEELNGFPLEPGFQISEWVPSAGCGTDIYGNPICSEVTVAAVVPQELPFYVHGKTAPRPELQAYLVHKDGYESNMPTGIPQTQVVPVAWPVVKEVTRQNSSTSDVRWKDQVSVRGSHLWTYLLNDPPAGYESTMCVVDGADQASFEGALEPTSVQWTSAIPHHGNLKFQMWEHPFDVQVGEASTWAVSTPLEARGFFEPTCAAVTVGTSQEMTNLDDGIDLAPPRITGADSSEDDELVVVEVEQSNQPAQVHLLGDDLNYYRELGYLTAYLNSLGGGLVGDEISPSGVSIEIPANPPIGEYVLHRTLADSGFTSGVQGPTIVVRVVTPQPTITSITPADRQWRDDAGSSYYLTVSGQHFGQVSEDEIEVHLDGTKRGQVVSGSKTDTSFRVYFPYGLGAQPGTYSLSVVSTGTPFAGNTTIQGFQLKGFSDGSYSKSYTWTRNLTGCSASYTKEVSVVDQGNGDFSVAFVYSGNSSEVTTYHWDGNEPPAFCSGFIVSNDCSTILHCNINNPDACALNPNDCQYQLSMLHYYPQTEQWRSQVLADSVPGGLYHDTLYFLANGPDGRTAVVSTPMGGSNYLSAFALYRFGDATGEFGFLWNETNFNCTDGQTCYNMTSVQQASDRIEFVKVGTTTLLSNYDLRYPL